MNETDKNIGRVLDERYELQEKIGEGGDRIGGVSTMYLAHELDSGDVIYTEETEIGEKETSGELFERLKDMGAALLVRTLRDIEEASDLLEAKRRRAVQQARILELLCSFEALPLHDVRTSAISENCLRSRSSCA